MESSREHSPLLQQIDDGTLERFAPEPVRVRALDLFLLGRVRNRLVSGNRLLAEVTGTRDTYLVTVDVLASPTGPDAIGRCQCPRRPRSGLCKHAIAVLYAWVHEPDSFQSVDRRLDRLAALPRASLLALIRRLVELEPALLAEVDAGLPAGEATGADPAAPDAPAPGEGDEAPVPRWLRWLEETPDPDPAVLDRLRKELDEDPGDAHRVAGLDALLVAALWRQAGLARLAARRGEDRTAAFLRDLWRRLVGLVLATAAPRQALPAIGATADMLGPAALREAGEALLEAGWPGPALALARRALAAEDSPGGVIRARHLVARAWLALGRPDEAIPYLAANLATHPDAATLQLLEEAAALAGREPEIETALREWLAAPGYEGLRVEHLLRRRRLAELARVLADPQARRRVPGPLLLESADTLRREDPHLARELYEEVIRRGEAAPDDPAMRARMEAVAGLLPSGPDTAPGDRERAGTASRHAGGEDGGEEGGDDHEDE
ncbi:MAG TPA: hypothetical protein VIK99_07915 [Thermaerobacter sp.]